MMNHTIHNRSRLIMLVALVGFVVLAYVLYRLPREKAAKQELARMKREEQVRVDKQRKIARHALNTLCDVTKIEWDEDFRDTVYIQFAGKVWTKGSSEPERFFGSVEDGKIEDLQMGSWSYCIDGKLYRPGFARDRP